MMFLLTKKENKVTVGEFNINGKSYSVFFQATVSIKIEVEIAS